MRQAIRNALPLPLRPVLRDIYYSLADLADLLLLRRDALTPPRRLVPFGVSDFKKIGDEFLNYFVELADLKPNERLLEIGCGTGRMAVPLIRYLSREGRYDGVDIVPESIAWCRRRISRRFPHLQFHAADVYNERYNPKGIIQAREYRFPFENDSFDFVFLTSVFTHMLAADIENYLAEIRRMMRPTARCLLTFFLINAESESGMSQKLSSIDFRDRLGESWTSDQTAPEAAIAYREEFIRRALEKNGLAVREPIQYGAWCGRKEFLSYQDIVITEREDRAPSLRPIRAPHAEGARPDSLG